MKKFWYDTEHCGLINLNIRMKIIMNTTSYISQCSNRDLYIKQHLPPAANTRNDSQIQHAILHSMVLDINLS